MPTIPQRIASAFAVCFGHYGDVTQMAKDREQSRQSLYREAQQVAIAVDGATAQARIDELQRQIAEECAKSHALNERLKHAVELTPDKQNEFATVAQAEGVSLSVARRLLRALTGPRPIRAVASLGRASLEAGKKAGPLLSVLDDAAKAAVKQGAADEIFWPKTRPDARRARKPVRADGAVGRGARRRHLGGGTRPVPGARGRGPRRRDRAGERGET